MVNTTYEMASVIQFKVVYKVAQGSEIDATVFLPSNQQTQCPVRE